MFYHWYFLQKHPQASSAGRDTAPHSFGACQKTGQKLLLCSTFRPVIVPPGLKKSVICDAKLHLSTTGDNLGWGMQRCAGAGASAPGHLQPMGSWWDLCNAVDFLKISSNVFRAKPLIWLRPLCRTSLARHWHGAVGWGQQGCAAALPSESYVASCLEG